VVVDGVVTRFNGKSARLVHITDITQQRRAEARLAQAEATLRQAEKLEAIGDSRAASRTTSTTSSPS